MIKSGTGATPTAQRQVTAHYKGTLLDGTVFDSSYDRNEPITMPANAVIKGWTEALTMMKVGDKWQLFIPVRIGLRREGRRRQPSVPMPCCSSTSNCST